MIKKIQVLKKVLKKFSEILGMQLGIIGMQL